MVDRACFYGSMGCRGPSGWRAGWNSGRPARTTLPAPSCGSETPGNASKRGEKATKTMVLNGSARLFEPKRPSKPPSPDFQLPLPAAALRHRPPHLQRQLHRGVAEALRHPPQLAPPGGRRGQRLALHQRLRGPARHADLLRQLLRLLVALEPQPQQRQPRGRPHGDHEARRRGRGARERHGSVRVWALGALQQQGVAVDVDQAARLQRGLLNLEKE